MSFLIGKFSPRQYTSYLIPGLDQKKQGISRHWVSHFNLARYPILVVIIHRLAYWIIHRFSVYPTNNLLFNNFKSYKFRCISTEEQYKIVKKIFKRFQLCSGFDQNELDRIGAELKAVKQQFVKKKEEVPAGDELKEEKIEKTEPYQKAEEAKIALETEEAKKAEQEVKSEEIEKGEEKARAEEAKKVNDAEEIKRAEIEKFEKDIEMDESEKDYAETPKEEDQQLDLNQSGKQPSADLSDDDILDPDEDDQPNLVNSADSEAGPVIVYKDPSLNIKDKPPTEEEIISSHRQTIEEEDHLDEEGLSLTLSDEENDETQSKEQPLSKLEDNTWERLSLLFEGLSQSQMFFDEDDEQEELLEEAIPDVVSISLPDDVQNIVSQPFLLEDTESLNELFHKKDAQAVKHQYRKNLKTLLSFEKQLQVENQKTEDPRFEEYLRKADQAFHTAWTAACDEVAKLHADFIKKFPKNPPQLKDNGEVICTAAQLDWVIETISHRFPAIYQFAFDAPSLEIYQSRQMASLAQIILMGPDVEIKERSSSCFICLRETVDKKTPVFEDDEKDNPLVKAGSFIFTLLFGPSGKIGEDKGELKQKFCGLAHAYVRDWLQSPGVVLQFDKQSINGGQSTETIKSSDWVAHMRDLYTQTLLTMTKEELIEEINNLSYNCRLVRTIAMTYSAEIEEGEWADSHFPAAIMEKIFEEELRSNSNNRQVKLAIRQTMDDSSFNDPADIKTLAETAGCSDRLIEPLVRIRVLYMMGCLGQTGIEPVLRGIDQRAKTMYDPDVCKTFDGQVLFCQPGKERILSFNNGFDKLDISVKTFFKDRYKIHLVAQGESSLSIESLNRSNKEGIRTAAVDLRDLRFSLYSSKAQRRYLTAQVNPQTLVDYMQQLTSDVAELKLVKNAENYQIENEANQNKWFWNRSFDPKTYQNYDQDSRNLDDAIRKGTAFVTCWNTQQALAYCNQLSPEQSKRFKESSNKIQNFLKEALNVLATIYIGNDLDEDWNALTHKVQRLRQMIDLHSLPIGVVEADLEEESSSNSLASDEEIGDFDFDDYDEEVIGKTAGTESRGLLGMAYDYSLFGLLLNETSEVKYLKWKIERYEDLIEGTQKSTLDYIQEAGLGDIQQLIKQGSSADAPDWMRELLPVFKLCRKGLREDRARLNPEYLKRLRDTHQVLLLGSLRKAATWVEEHPQMVGIDHIDAVCDRFYTTVDLNHRCKEVLKTFQTLGQDAACDEAEIHSLPEDSLYDLIRDLHSAHQQIKAVPNDAKAPKIKQWLNSARGHINGFRGVTAFDPNMQSNPLHVFHKQVITIKGQASGPDTTLLVKDIAMGSPTIEGGDGNAQIAPEFLGFMRHYKRSGFTHGYFNNQNFIPKAWVEGDESVRCQALHDLADKEFKGTLYVTTLSQNSPFYQQMGHEFSSHHVKDVKDAVITQLLDGKSKAMRNYLPSHLILENSLHEWMAKEIDRIHQEEFENCSAFDDEAIREQFVQRFHDQLRAHIDTLLKLLPGEEKGFGYSIYDPSAAKFKTEMIEQMFDRTPHETGNCLSADLVKKHDLRTWSVQAADRIHQKLFGGRAQLTVQERRIFIRLFYLFLVLKILIAIFATSYNLSCKDRIDRGAASDAEVFAYLAILQNCMNDAHVIEFFKMLVFARAIIVRKRTIIEERLERLMETVKFMLENQKKLQELHAELFPGVEMTVDQFMNHESDAREETLVSETM